jgi:hypothetical protein
MRDLVAWMIVDFLVTARRRILSPYEAKRARLEVVPANACVSFGHHLV